MRHHWLLPLPLLLISCAPVGDEARDPADDCVTCTDKADGGYTSDQIIAILRVANESSREVLDHEVGINADTAAAIVAARGSGFATLEQLDDVPHVGQSAMDALLRYGVARGYDKPWLPPGPWPVTWDVWGFETWDTSSCPISLHSSGTCWLPGPCSSNSFSRRLKKTFTVAADGTITTSSTGGGSGLCENPAPVAFGHTEWTAAPDPFSHCFASPIHYDADFTASAGRLQVDESCWADYAYLDDDGERVVRRGGGNVRFVSDPAGGQHLHAKWTGGHGRIGDTSYRLELACDVDGTFEASATISCDLEIGGYGLHTTVTDTFERLLEAPRSIWFSRVPQSGGYPRLYVSLHLLPPTQGGQPFRLFVDHITYEPGHSESFSTGRPGDPFTGDSSDYWRTADLVDRHTGAHVGRWLGPTSATDAPSRRVKPHAFWTGDRMLIWAGSHEQNHVISSGGLYDPAADRWTAMATDGAPALMHSAAVWTGAELLVRGGRATGAQSNDLIYAYDPSSDRWRASRPEGAPAPAYNDSTVWTGSELVIFGGQLGNAYRGDGWRYDPATGQARTISSEGAPSARAGHMALWTGSEMLVWGGYVGTVTPTATGARYSPAEDRWRPMAAGGPGVVDHGIWAGDRAVLWSRSGTAWSYEPAADRWTELTPPQALLPRSGSSLVWTGDRLVLWGGYWNSETDDQRGAIWDPTTGAWQEMPAGERAPAGRANHAAVWTGSEMIVWGGDTDGLNRGSQSGGRFALED
jgi:hypothetical protein